MFTLASSLEVPPLYETSSHSISQSSHTSRSGYRDSPCTTFSRGVLSSESAILSRAISCLITRRVSTSCQPEPWTSLLVALASHSISVSSVRRDVPQRQVPTVRPYPADLIRRSVCARCDPGLSRTHPLLPSPIQHESESDVWRSRAFAPASDIGPGEGPSLQSNLTMILSIAITLRLIPQQRLSLYTSCQPTSGPDTYPARWALS